MNLDLLYITAYLRTHRDQMYVMPGKKSAMVYYPANDCVMVIHGDFSGGPEECNLELQKGLRKLQAE